MDLWLIAATAATGYITKHLQNVSKGKESFQESSSQDLSNAKLESPRCLARGKKPKEENFEDCLNEDVFECGNPYEVEDEIHSDSFGNRAFLTRKRRYTSLIKPFYAKKSAMSRLHRENFSMEEEYLRSPFPSPCVSVTRPLFVVTDGRKVISKNIGDSIKQQVPDCGIPQLRKVGSSALYAKRRVGIEKSSVRRSDQWIGSNDAVSLLCVGISIGIMSSFVANEALKQTKNLVKGVEDEAKTADSSTMKDDLRNDEKTAENSESISKIEAELEAELERLEINLNSSNVETRISDVIEMEPDFEVEFAQGELRDDLVNRQGFDETESNQEPSGNYTPASGNYTVSPRELSLCLHKVINSRYEERIKELEIALEESQRKVEKLVMESEEKMKSLPRCWETTQEVMKYKRDSKKHNDPANIQPMVMNLAGEALDAFNESYEELMDINDYSDEEHLPFEMQENEELSLRSKSSPWSHIKDSSRTLEDVSIVRLQDLLGLSDNEEEEEDGDFESEMEKQLIKQIVEKTKQGSSAVLNAQKMLFLMEEIEHNQ